MPSPFRPALTNATDNIPVSVAQPRLDMKNPHAILNALGNKRNGDNLSLFSSINGFHGPRNPKPQIQQGE